MHRNTVPISLHAWGLSDAGQVRDNNEDCFLALDLTTGAVLHQEYGVSPVVGNKGFLLMVADGMGGHEAGEVASRMAVDLVSQHVSTCLARNRPPSRWAFVDILTEAVVHANAAIYQASQSDPKHSGMGTTLTAAGVYDGAAFFAQVGDSRAYLLRTNSVAQMTQDQNLATELATSGTGMSAQLQVEGSIQNVLLQALGAEPEVTVPVSFLELRHGDWIVVCSDGLTNMVSDEVIGHCVQHSSDPQAACQALVTAANVNGGLDNITVIAAHCDGPTLPAPQTSDNPQAQKFVIPWWYRFVRYFQR
jgi:protein phosphatase